MGGLRHPSRAPPASGGWNIYSRRSLRRRRNSLNPTPDLLHTPSPQVAYPDGSGDLPTRKQDLDLGFANPQELAQRTDIQKRFHP